MTDYRVTYWENGKQYMYRISTNNLQMLTIALKQKHDRFIIQEAFPNE